MEVVQAWQLQNLTFLLADLWQSQQRHRFLLEQKSLCNSCCFIGTCNLMLPKLSRHAGHCCDGTIQEVHRPCLVSELSAYVSA